MVESGEGEHVLVGGRVCSQKVLGGDRGVGVSRRQCGVCRYMCLFLSRERGLQLC